MTARKQPDFWVEITEEAYPRTTPPTKVTTTRSTRPLAFAGSNVVGGVEQQIQKIPGRIRAGSYSEIERALSDWQGNVEAATFTWEEEDSDGQGRALAGAIGTSRFANPEVCVKMLSEAGRKAGLAPRVIQRGYLSSPPQPTGNRKIRYEAIDALGSKFYHFDPEAPIQTQFITREHLIPAGISGTPAEKVGKPYNIVIGEHTDRGATTACGTSAVKGLVPVDYIGQMVVDGTWPTVTSRSLDEVVALLQASADSHTLDDDWGDVIGHDDANALQAYCDGGGSVPSTYEALAQWIGYCDLNSMMGSAAQECLNTGNNIQFLPPPVLTASVVGAAGTSTWSYAVTGITASGAETAFSNIVTVTNAPSVAEMVASGGTRYISLSWAAPAGSEASYAALIVGYRVSGRRLNPPTTYLTIRNNNNTWLNPETTYSDTGAAQELNFASPTCQAQVATDENGDVVLGNEVWGVFVVGLGALRILSIYGSDLAEGTEPARSYLDPSNPNIISPLSANWPHTTDYVDVNGTRLTLFYARGTLAQQHIDGTITFAVTCCGVEDVGDGSGTMIDTAGPGLQWLLNEVVLKQYRTGLYGPLQTYKDNPATPILKTSTFTAFQTATIGFIGGVGYKMGLVLTERTSLTEVLQMWCLTFTAYVGTTPNGQITVHVFDNTIQRSTMKHLREKIEIDGPLPDPEISEEEIENRILYKWDYDADAGDYRLEAVTIEDTTSQAIYGIRNNGGGGGQSEDFLGLRCTRDETTARDSMGRRLRMNKFPALYQEFPVGMIGYQRNLGDCVRVTHPDGITVNGYTEHVFFLTRQIFDLNTPQQRVRLVGRYVDYGLVTAVAPSPNTVTVPTLFVETAGVEAVAGDVESEATGGSHSVGISGEGTDLVMVDE